VTGMRMYFKYIDWLSGMSVSDREEELRQIPKQFL